jgi:hypothetical protein
MSFAYHFALCWSTTDMSQLVACRGIPVPTWPGVAKLTVIVMSRVAPHRGSRGEVMPSAPATPPRPPSTAPGAGYRPATTWPPPTARRPSPSARGGLTTEPQSAEADGSSPYTGDSAPLSRLATLSLRTITPSADRAWQPGAGEPLPISCSIVRHKPTTRAPLESNKPHRSETEVISSHTRPSFGSATAMKHPADGNSLHCDTQ